MKEKVTAIISTIKVKVQQGLNSVSLSLIYFLGIGPTSIVGKTVNKSFLQTKPQVSNWMSSTDSRSTTLDKMF